MPRDASWTHEQADEYLRAQAARYARLREDAERVKQQLAEARATVASPNGAVTVTVGSGGVMQSIRVRAASGERAAGAVVLGDHGGVRQGLP